MKHLLYLLIGMLFAVGIVLGAECTVTPINGTTCELLHNLTLNYSNPVYNVSFEADVGTGSDSEITLDCNGTTIICDRIETESGACIDLFSHFDYFAVKNCNIISNGSGVGISISSYDYIEFRNDYFLTLSDPIVGGMDYGYIVLNNTFMEQIGYLQNNGFALDNYTCTLDFAIGTWILKDSTIHLGEGASFYSDLSGYDYSPCQPITETHYSAGDLASITGDVIGTGMVEAKAWIPMWFIGLLLLLLIALYLSIKKRF